MLRNLNFHKNELYKMVCKMVQKLKNVWTFLPKIKLN